MLTTCRAWIGVAVCLTWFVGCGDASSTGPGHPVTPPDDEAPAATAPHANPKPHPTVQPDAATKPDATAAAPASAGAGAAKPNTPGMAGAAPAAMTPQTDATTVTYHKDIRPIMVTNCSSACHGPDAMTRAGPFALDTYEATKAVGSLVANAVTTGRMPPWPPDEKCRPLRDTPKITDAQRALFTKWKEADFPEGNPTDYVAPPPDVESDLGEPTRVIEMAQPHTPPAEADQYYCAIVDYKFEKDTYIKAIEVIPDQKTMVHHVQVHRLGSNLCTVGDNMFSWRPGGKRLTFSEGDAALIPAGSYFGLQMHYNTFGKKPAPDKTKVALWELPAGKTPERVVTRVGVFGFVNTMPPGAVVSTKASSGVGGAGSEIIGVSPHAHMIAKHMNATLKRSGGKTECLTDVPDWSFEWQLDYIFKEPLPLQAGDVVNATCDYDNGPDHQPTIDGVKRQQPITVTAGEGSADEMCLHYVWVRKPFQK